VETQTKIIISITIIIIGHEYLWQGVRGRREGKGEGTGVANIIEVDYIYI
jgi:hypothetical protein